MSNERLRAAMLEHGLTPTMLARSLDVDPKSVERWIAGRTPYRKHRYAVAALLGMDESTLWPDALSARQVAAAAESEIVAVYPHRWTMPRDAWGRLFESAEREIDILVYSGLFLADDTGVQTLLSRKASEGGVRIRVLLGDPASAEVATRGTDERIGEAIAAKIRNVLVLYEPLRASGAEIRLHGTVLYNSIYRADDQVLVNAHVYGSPASNAPVLHLRKVAGGDMVTMYRDSFERVWGGATPLD
jgi:hypothetical protein